MPSEESPVHDCFPGIPHHVLVKARHLGRAGADLLARLPETLGHLEHQWSLSIGKPLPRETAAYVAPVRRADGTAAVLKLMLPDGSFAAQADTLARADGWGSVRLLDRDDDILAMLLEPLGDPLGAITEAPEAQIDILCETLPYAWQVPPVPADRQRADEKAASLIRDIEGGYERLHPPRRERAVAKALAYGHRRAEAFDLGRCVVVHGDPHLRNALRALSTRAGAPSGFVFVDPDGFLADPTYD